MQAVGFLKRAVMHLKHWMVRVFLLNIDSKLTNLRSVPVFPAAMDGKKNFHTRFVKNKIQYNLPLPY